jgi:hypothetical protein
MGQNNLKNHVDAYKPLIPHPNSTYSIDNRLNLRYQKTGNGVGDIIQFRANIRHMFDSYDGVNIKDIIHAVPRIQEAAGYPPVAYDGPWNIRLVGYDVYWSCAASCD